MSTPNLEQIARETAEKLSTIRHPKGFHRDDWAAYRDSIQSIILAALRSVAQPEPKRFPAEKGTGTVPEEVKRAVEKALESYMEGPDYTKAATDAVMQAIAPFVAGGEDKDTRIVDWLAMRWDSQKIGKQWLSLCIENPTGSFRDACLAAIAARAATTPGEGGGEVSAGITIGHMTDAPASDFPGLNAKASPGDTILTFCHIQGGGGWWCGPYKVKYMSGDAVVYRPKFAKVDKSSSTWIIRNPPSP